MISVQLTMKWAQSSCRAHWSFVTSLRKGTAQWTWGGSGFRDSGIAFSHEGMFADTLWLSPLAYFENDFQDNGWRKTGTGAHLQWQQSSEN